MPIITKEEDIHEKREVAATNVQGDEIGELQHQYYEELSQPCPQPSALL
jgi:hypothetical protein